MATGVYFTSLIFTLLKQVMAADFIFAFLVSVLLDAAPCFAGAHRGVSAVVFKRQDARAVCHGSARKSVHRNGD